MVIFSQDLTRTEFEQQVGQLKELARGANEEEAREIVSKIAQISRKFRIQTGIGLPQTPIEQAIELNPDYVIRPHLTYTSNRITKAVRDVERGRSRRLLISMPPRSGKTFTVSNYTPLWILRRHPEWKVMMASYDGGLTRDWAQNIRRMIENHPELGIALQKDAGAAGRWSTVENGGMFATGVGGSLIGRGARVVIVDDPIADFAAAHNQKTKQALWNWWLSVLQSRLEPPFLLIVVMTRWVEDDLVGRILSTEHEGDPSEWERIILPAIAQEGDVIGRSPGEPLYSPLLDETEDQAIARWMQVKANVGNYAFAGMYQQQPAPSEGAIFDYGSWRYWTRFPDKANDDGTVVYLDPNGLPGGKWVDSWDASFGSTGENASWVVGQRWVRQGDNRYLVAQVRGRWTFTETIRQMQAFSERETSIYGRHVQTRLIEKKANGAAIIEVLSDTVDSIKPIIPVGSKESRARAHTPDLEAGKFYLPYPGDPGNEWVYGLLSELRNFPNDAHDDQCLVGETLVTVRGRGEVPIAEVVRGEQVLGASGWVTVLESGSTGQAPVVNNAGLRGTANHPVWTERGWLPLSQVEYSDTLWTRVQLKDVAANKLLEAGALLATSVGGSFQSLAQTFLRLPEFAAHRRRALNVEKKSASGLIQGCAGSAGLLGAGRTSRKSNVTESSFGGIRIPVAEPTGTTTSPQVSGSGKGWRLSTVKSTNVRLDRSRRGTTSITETPTQATTNPTTLWRFLRESISKSPLRGGESEEDRGGIVKQCWPIWRAFVGRLRSGIAVKKARNGTVSTQNTCEIESVYNLTTSDGTYFANGVLVHNCDSLTQALDELKDEGRGGITNPTSVNMFDRRLTRPGNPTQQRIGGVGITKTAMTGFRRY